MEWPNIRSALRQKCRDSRRSKPNGNDPTDDNGPSDGNDPADSDGDGNG